MIKKLLIVMFLLLGVANASGIQWEKDYQSGLMKAKMTGKPVLFIVSSHNCRYCVKLEKETLSNGLVIKGLNRDYINIIAYVDGGDHVPKELLTGGTPTIWFLHPDGEPLFQPLMGAIDAENFVKALAIVKTEYDDTKK